MLSFQSSRWQMLKGISCGFVLVALASLQALAEDSPLKVFVLAGTSNMTGGGARTAELSEELRQPQKDVLVFQGGGMWTPMEAGKVPRRGNNFGVEVSFGRAMAKHFGEPIGIITGGMSTASPDQGGYAGIVASVKAAQKSRPIVIAGMCVQLYEVDSRTEETAKAYPQNIVRYIESARRDFGNPDMPFVKNKVLTPTSDPSKIAVTPQSLPVSNFVFLEMVRKDEAAIDLPGFGRTDLDDLPRGGDKVHYDTKGILELGERHAATMIELLKAAKK